MPDVVGGEDYLVPLALDHQRLRREDHISVEPLVRRGWLPFAPRLRPQLGGDYHYGCGELQVKVLLLQRVKPLNAVRLLCPDQLAADLVVGNLRNDHASPSTLESDRPI